MAPAVITSESGAGRCAQGACQNDRGDLRAASPAPKELESVTVSQHRPPFQLWASKCCENTRLPWPVHDLAKESRHALGVWHSPNHLRDASSQGDSNIACRGLTAWPAR